jgi:hypothetical protein
MKLHELYAQVTNNIIKDLEGGVATWVKPCLWHLCLMIIQKPFVVGEWTMRAKALLIIFASLLASSACHAGQCPADPFKASKAIWNWGDIPTGAVRTGVHPCGRKMTCVGGAV